MNRRRFLQILGLAAIVPVVPVVAKSASPYSRSGPDAFREINAWATERLNVKIAAQSPGNVLLNGTRQELSHISQASYSRQIVQRMRVGK